MLESLGVAAGSRPHDGRARASGPGATRVGADLTAWQAPAGNTDPQSPAELWGDQEAPCHGVSDGDLTGLRLHSKLPWKVPE